MREVLLSTVVAMFACASPVAEGEPDGGASASDGGHGERYFPMEVGMSWSYRVVDVATGEVGAKTQTVEALEDIGGSKSGIAAFRLRSDKPVGYTLSWQEDTGSALVRHLEESYSGSGAGKTAEVYLPGKLRLDESLAHVSMGATFDDTYTEAVTDVATGVTTTVEKTEQWTVEAVDEEITVPAGTFSCLRLRRVNATTGSDKRYWFARGYGKVKEEGASQIELLRSFALQ